MDALGVVHYGLGPIGLEVARLVSQRADLVTVGAIDVDPTLLGKTLGSLIRSGSDVKVSSAGVGLAAGEAQVVLHCTGSSLERVAPQLSQCLQAGLPVVSTCEELSYPWKTMPQLASDLDDIARQHGVALLGTGVNPGFVMDFLPVVLSGAARAVDHVRVHRVQEAGNRRLPLQRKIGAGLTVEEFGKLAATGTIRHVGLPESASALAAALGWELTSLDNSIEPVLATRVTPSGLGDIQPGYVTGVHQIARGYVADREVVVLELEMAVGLDEPRDEVFIQGEPPIHMVLPGGLHGDVATAAIVVNAIPRVLEARPGLRTMADLAPPRSIGR